MSGAELVDESELLSLLDSAGSIPDCSAESPTSPTLTTPLEKLSTCDSTVEENSSGKHKRNEIELEFQEISPQASLEVPATPSATFSTTPLVESASFLKATPSKKKKESS